MTRYRKILLATDFSGQAKRALAEAVRLARRNDAELHVVFVEVVALQGVGTFGEPAVPDYLRNLNQAPKNGDANSDLSYRKSVVKVVRDASEPAGLLRYAREQGVDLIVLGTHGRGRVSELMLGSVAQAVVHQAPVSVLVVSPRAANLHGRCILAPVDFSPRSRAALIEAGRLAAASSSRLVALNVVDFARVQHPEQMDIGEREARARAALERLVAEAALPVAAETLVTVGPAAADIMRIAAQHDAGLIVMAESGHTDFERVMIGSVCKAVVRAAPCPVLVHREAAGKSGQLAAA